MQNFVVVVVVEELRGTAGSGEFGTYGGGGDVENSFSTSLCCSKQIFSYWI